MQNADGAQPAKIPSYQLIYPLPWPAHKDLADPNTKQEEFGHNRRTKEGEPPRAHAGIDLVAPVGTPVLAMAAGTVLRMTDGFTPGTGAIEVAHPGLGIVRYGEVSPESIESFSVMRDFLMEGQHVKPGQVIGFVGKRIESRDKNGKPKFAKRSMLHLELYSDWKDDKIKVHRLSDPANHDYDNLPENLANRPYQRRHDLLDPTDVVARAHVQGLEKLGIYDLLTSSHKPALSLQDLMVRAVLIPLQNQPHIPVPSKK